MDPAASRMEQLRDLVMTQWDPIGVNDLDDDPDECALYWGEYDNYLPTILARLDAGDDVDWLTSYLTHVSTKLMGLSPNPDHSRNAAQAIVDRHQRATSRKRCSLSLREPTTPRRPTLFGGDQPTIFGGA